MCVWRMVVRMWPCQWCWINVCNRMEMFWWPLFNHARSISLYHSDVHFLLSAFFYFIFLLFFLGHERSSVARLNQNSLRELQKWTRKPRVFRQCSMAVNPQFMSVVIFYISLSPLTHKISDIVFYDFSCTDDTMSSHVKYYVHIAVWYADMIMHCT